MVWIARGVAVSTLAWHWVMKGSQPTAAATTPGPPLSCTDDIEACLDAVGKDELRAVYAWARDLPRGPTPPPPGAPGGSALEGAALGLFGDLSLALLATALDAATACRGDPRCPEASRRLRRVPALRASLEEQLARLARRHAAGPGARSPVLRTGRILRSALDGLSRRLGPGGAAAEEALELARLVGRQAQALSRQLGAHAWVRALRVPGRGAPVFVLHDEGEHGPWPGALRALLAAMVRNGRASPSLAELGAADGGAAAAALLAEFGGLRYLAVLPEAPPAGLLGQLSARLRPYGARAELRLAAPAAAAAAVPRRSLDVAVLDAGGGARRVAQDLEWWEGRVRPGGILGGRGFEPGSEGVQAVCGRRFGNDIHLGAGGSFWWYVEPDEEG